MSAKQKHTRFVKDTAISLGFSNVRIAKAEKMDEESKRLEEWLNQGYHGEMSYMENHFEKRTDPRKLVTGAKSVISLAYNYYTSKKQSDSSAPKISMYAFGRDYHKVVRKRLKNLFQLVRGELGDVQGRYFVDSAPVMERDWAKRSGLGWVGKNTLLIHPEMGSYFFLAELIVDIELDYDQPSKDYCGTCTRCIEACPTEAISPQGYLVDGSKCISYLTIELKDAIPDEFQGRMENWAFGCDICQDVCPWNRFSRPHAESEFEPSVQMLNMDENAWVDLKKDEFDKLFKGSAVKRTGFSGLKRNIDFLQKKENAS